MAYSNWNETEHPRDDIGRFTYKNGGASSSKDEKIQEKIKKENLENTKMQKMADILYPTMKDKKGALTGGAADVGTVLKGGIEINAEQQENRHSPLNEIAVDYIDNAVVKMGGSVLKGREAAENLLMSKANSYLDTDYAREHFIFNNCQELSKDLRTYFEDKIASQIGKDEVKNTKGIFIDGNSNSSKYMTDALVKNKDFMQKISEFQNTMKQGNVVNTTVEFADRNFHNAIGKADVRQMHIDNKGNLDLLVTDVYDFNKNDKSDLVQVARERQEKGEIKPYFIIYHVIIPKDKLK